MKTAQFCLMILFAVSCLSGEDRGLGPKDGFDLKPADPERVQVGMPAPDFALESKDAAIVTLSQFRGKKNVVMVFYRGYW